MTLAQALRLYNLYTFCSHDETKPEDDPRRAYILADLRRVVSATTHGQAAEVIDWWGWNSTQEKIGYVRRCWRLAKEMGLR